MCWNVLVACWLLLVFAFVGVRCASFVVCCSSPLLFVVVCYVSLFVVVCPLVGVGVVVCCC